MASALSSQRIRERTLLKALEVSASCLQLFWLSWPPLRSPLRPARDVRAASLAAHPIALDDSATTVEHPIILDDSSTPEEKRTAADVMHDVAAAWACKLIFEAGAFFTPALQLQQLRSKVWLETSPQAFTCGKCVFGSYPGLLKCPRRCCEGR